MYNVCLIILTVTYYFTCTHRVDVTLRTTQTARGEVVCAHVGNIRGVFLEVYNFKMK